MFPRKSREQAVQRTNVLPTFVLLLTLVGLLSFQHVWADKKEKEWPPMPLLDSLVGDTSGAITIKDSALIPTFGIYPVGGWGKATYIDTNTFKKYGMVVFFDPWDEPSQRYVESLSELREKIESEWGFEVFLITCRMSIVSCRKYLSKDKRQQWDCRIFLMPSFKGVRNSNDSLQKILTELKLAFPVYRLKQPLKFNEPGDKHFDPVLLTAKQNYVAYLETAPLKTPKMMGKSLIKMGIKVGFPAMLRGLEEDWKNILSGGGDGR
jgi:hypothetical protein